MRPPFASLPLRDGDPPYSAWGLYGLDDQLGSLNLLTETVVAAAAKDIQKGVRIGLNLPLNIPHPATHNRYFKHHVIHKAPRAVYDDVVDMNTQCSSQWDGLRHFGYQQSKVFYNGVTADDIGSSDILGIHSWCARGIVGRGVLLDVLQHRQASGGKIDCFGPTEITLSELKDCATAQGLSFKEGDILLIRIGWGPAYLALSQREKEELPNMKPFYAAGVQTHIDVLEWIWENGFSAVAGDAFGFEALAPNTSNDERGLDGALMHEVIIGGWGMPIGEMLDLEALSDECRKEGRYTFFLSSMPLNIPGGVGTPANMVAIF